MKLIDVMMEPYVLMEKRRTPDGEGGLVTVWTDGAEIKAAVTLDTTMQARIAQHDGVKSVYTVTTSRAIKLSFHDVIKRVSDGKIFRITSDGGEKKSPMTTTLDISQVTAEGWQLT